MLQLAPLAGFIRYSITALDAPLQQTESKVSIEMPALPGEFDAALPARAAPIPCENVIVHRSRLVNIARLRPVDYFDAMFNLTRQQQLFLCSILLLLLVGWAVKAWRTAHPPARATISAAP